MNVRDGILLVHPDEMSNMKFGHNDKRRMLMYRFLIGMAILTLVEVWLMKFKLLKDIFFLQDGGK